jgi:Domain of unknown function (DUF4349)
MSAIDRNELDGYEALVAELRATAPVAPDRLRERVLEGAPAPRRRRSRRRKLALVVVPVAVVLAVGAALVHGFVNSGSRYTDLRLNPRVPGAGAVPAPLMGSNHLVQKSSGKQVFSASSGSVAAQSDALGKAPLAAQRGLVTIPRNRLVHAVASLEVRVKSRSDLSAKTNQASQIVGSLGGYAQSVHYQNSRNGYGEADLQLRVPVERAEAAIAKLSTLGVLVSQQVSTQDLQAKVTRQTSAIGSLRRAIAVYESALQSPTLPASQRAILQIRLNNARHQLTQLRNARQGTVAAGATANISLVLTTRNHAVVAPHHGSGRLGRLLGSAAHFLALEGIIVLYALIVLAPVLLIGGLAWWILRERRRREERLLASA